MRLLCLQSLTGGGIRVNKYDFLRYVSLSTPQMHEQQSALTHMRLCSNRREIIQTYGYEYMFALNNMEQVGLVRKAEAINVFGSGGGGEREGLGSRFDVHHWLR